MSCPNRKVCRNQSCAWQEIRGIANKVGMNKHSMHSPSRIMRRQNGQGFQMEISRWLKILFFMCYLLVLAMKIFILPSSKLICTFLFSFRNVPPNFLLDIVSSVNCCCSVTQLCLSFCNPMDCSFPVLHYLPRFAQTHVH